MSSTFQYLADLVACRHEPSVVKRCEDQGCRLRLDGLPDRLVIKGDSLGFARRMPDCVIFAQLSGVLLVAVVELKSKTTHAREVTEKLTNGIRFALELLADGGRPQHVLYALVLSKSSKSSEYRTLTAKPLRVAGCAYRVLPKRCGVRLLDIV